MNKLHLACALLSASGLAASAYFYQQNSELEKILTANNSRCEDKLLKLASDYEDELKRIQAEIDRRIVMQANMQSTEVAYVKPPEHILDESESVKPQLERYDESIADIVRRKYRFLFATLELSPAEMEELRMLLIEREELALKIRDARTWGDEAGISKDELWDLEYQLEDVETRIEDFLDGQNAQRYAMLKDSDEEQEEFNQYALGINGMFPLNNKQQEAVLLTRLKHKQEFEKSLKHSGLAEDYPLTREQADELLKEVEMAAMRYKHRYLQAIRGELDHSNHPMDQYTMLENFTNTEFQELIDELKQKIEARGIIN